MFDQIRALISGAVPEASLETTPDRLTEWSEKSLERWLDLRDGLPVDAPERCPDGYMWYAFEFDGELR